MRLKQRMNVDLPHPDGPMNAVTVFSWTSSVTFRERELAGVGDGEIRDVEDLLARRQLLLRRSDETSAIRELSIGGVRVHARMGLG